MAPTNKSAALKARHANHGGPRRNGGRPLGAKDTTKRKGSISEKERSELLQAELGKARKEIERLRNELNYGKVFKGSPRELLEAASRGEYVPTQEQLYSTKLLFDREPAAVNTDGTGAVLILPSNGRDPGLENREWLGKEFAKLHRQHVFETNRKVRRWIETGKTTEEQALLYRPLWTDEGDPEWEPVITVPPEPAMQYIAPPVAEPEFIAPVPPRHFNGNGIDLKRLYPPLGARYNFYKTISGREYEVSAEGVVPDEQDRAKLMGAGWRPRD
jgi:hypothetical protein